MMKQLEFGKLMVFDFYLLQLSLIFNEQMLLTQKHEEGKKKVVNRKLLKIFCENLAHLC